MNVLVAYAASVEGAAIHDQLPDAVRLGVGKASAAATLAAELAGRKGRLPDAVLLFGVCGAYAEHGSAFDPLDVGDLCLVGSDQLADDGVADERGFQNLGKLALGEIGPFLMDDKLSAEAAERLGGLPIVPGATVSTASGTDDRALELMLRTGAQVESMEGAAVALVCSRYAVPCVQLRCVSNLCCDRQRARFDVPGATARVQRAALDLFARGFPTG